MSDAAGIRRLPNVLVVDPDASIGSLIKTALAGIGVTATVAGDGATARSSGAVATADIAFVEVQLPDGSGIALAGEIARAGGRPVLMSGHPQGILQAQASPYQLLQKPFRIKDVFRIVVIGSTP